MTLEELVWTAFDAPQERDGGEYWVDCCFCDDTKHRLGINVNTGVMHCFNCEEKSGDRNSRVNSLRRAYEKISQACNLDVEEFTVSDEALEEEKKLKRKEKYVTELPKAFEPLWKGINESIGRQAFRYITSRNVTKEQIKAHRIGFCAAGEYAYRIVFPVRYRNKCQGFVCRDFTGDAELKYINSEGSKGLYNIPAKSKRLKKAILVEGVFDVLAVERANIKGYDIIGGLGSKLKALHYKKLNTYNKIIVWAEPDEAGVEGTISRAKELQKRIDLVYVVIPDSDIESDTDPGAMSSEEIRDRLKDAVKFTSAIASKMRLRVAFAGKKKVKKRATTTKF